MLKKIGVIAMISILASAIINAILLFLSKGMEPEDVCDFVPDTSGLLPLNPNDGGDTVYSCNPDFFEFGVSVALLGAMLFCLGLFISGVIRFLKR